MFYSVRLNKHQIYKSFTLIKIEEPFGAGQTTQTSRRSHTSEHYDIKKDPLI